MEENHGPTAGPPAPEPPAGTTPGRDQLVAALRRLCAAAAEGTVPLPPPPPSGAAPDVPEGYLAIRQAAARLGVSAQTIRRRIRDGKLKTLRAGKRVAIEAKSLQRFIEVN